MKFQEKALSFPMKLYIAFVLLGCESAMADESIPVIGPIATKCISSVFPTVAGIYFGWQIVQCVRSGDRQARENFPVAAAAFGATVVLRNVMKYIGG